MAEGQTRNLAQIKERVIAEIKWLAKKGEPLNISAVKRIHPSLLKTVFHVRPFWGWKKAIEDAGLDYNSMFMAYDSSVTCQICGVEVGAVAGHLPVHNITTANYRKKYPNASLVSEEMRAKSFYSRSRSSRRPPTVRHWEEIWTPEYVLDRLHHIYRGTDGRDVRGGGRTQSEMAFFTRVRLCFGSVSKALTLAGVPRENVYMKPAQRKYAPKEIIASLRKRARQGLPVSRSTVERECGNLAHAAVRVFGSYRRALRAAGFDPDRVRQPKKCKYYTKEDVLRAIDARRALGKPLNQAGVKTGALADLALSNKARRLFGSWSKALEKAGIDPESVSIWRYRKPGTVIAAIRHRFANNAVPFAATAVRRGVHAEPTLYEGALRHFGNWANAVRAARVGYVPYKRKGVYPTREAVLTAIRERHKEGIWMSTHEMTQGSHPNPTLNAAFHKYFRTWREALLAAGLKDVVRSMGPIYPTARSVVAALRVRMTKGLPVRTAELFKGPASDRSLYNACRKFFGPYRAAMSAAGIEPCLLGRPRKSARHEARVRG